MLTHSFRMRLILPHSYSRTYVHLTWLVIIPTLLLILYLVTRLTTQTRILTTTPTRKINPDGSSNSPIFLFTLELRASTDGIPTFQTEHNVWNWT